MFSNNSTPFVWKRFNGALIEGSILDEVESALKREKVAGHKLKVCIGTDSQFYNTKIDFATVIVILREHKGGFMYIPRFTSQRKMGLKERMILEVSKSIEIAYPLCDVLDRNNVELEVHADINTDPSFKSNIALKEAMGYILSMGFEFKAKPDAFASSSCADKCV